MSERVESRGLDRRRFLKAVSVGLPAAAAGLGARRVGAAPVKGHGAPRSLPKPFLGIQTHAHDYFLEGAENVCIRLRDRGGFNAMLFAATYVEERKWTGHAPGNDYLVAAGAYFKPTARFYKSSGMEPVRAPAKGMEDYDALADACEAAQKTGVRIYAWLSDFDRRSFAGGHPECGLVDFQGKPGEPSWFCINHPRARAYATAFYEDIATHYAVDGFFMDRIRYPSPMGYCFCEHCVAKMTEAGIDVPRLRQSLGRLFARMSDPSVMMLVMAGASVDPVFYLEELPEIAQWMQFKMGSVASYVASVYQRVKEINPGLSVGLDVLAPMYSFGMGQNIGLLAAHSDWIKPMMYHWSAARGVRRFVEGSSPSGAKPDKAYELVRRFFALRGVEMAPTWAEFQETGMPPSWVARETRFAMEQAAGRALIFPGIQGWAPAKESDLEACLRAAFSAGAPGISTYCYSNLEWPKFAVYKRVFAELPAAG